MPYFKVHIDTDFLDELVKQSDSTCEEMLKAAAPIVKESLLKELGKHFSSGELADSVTAWPPRKLDSGFWVVSVTPSGKSSRSKRSGAKVYARSKTGRMSSGRALFNSDKLWWLEYGNSKQPARPVLQRAVNNANAEVVAKMTEVFARRIENK